MYERSGTKDGEVGNTEDLLNHEPSSYHTGPCPVSSLTNNSWMLDSHGDDPRKCIQYKSNQEWHLDTPFTIIGAKWPKSLQFIEWIGTDVYLFISFPLSVLNLGKVVGHVGWRKDPRGDGTFFFPSFRVIRIVDLVPFLLPLPFFTLPSDLVDLPPIYMTTNRDTRWTAVSMTSRCQPRSLDPKYLSSLSVPDHVTECGY